MRSVAWLVCCLPLLACSPGSASAKKKPEDSSAINVLRYGIKKRAYGVN